MLNDMMITALENKGFKRWTKGNMDRLYINATQIGLELSYYRTGNISAAYLNGEHISNSRGYDYKASKTYIDIKTGIVFSTHDFFKQAAQEILNTTISKLETA